MEVIFALPIIFIPFIMPFITGQMAKCFGRKFWPWFFIGIPLPFIANIILLCLPDKSKKRIRPVTGKKTLNLINHCGHEDIDLSALTEII